MPRKAKALWGFFFAFQYARLRALRCGEARVWGTSSRVYRIRLNPALSEHEILRDFAWIFRGPHDGGIGGGLLLCK
jgi:hypothetical protein